MNGQLSWKHWLGLLLAYFFALDASRGVTVPIELQEVGVGASEVVTISSSTIGNDVRVYAGVLDLVIDGSTTYGFCVDPWNWSGTGVQNYSTNLLTNAPVSPGPMDAGTAYKIEQLWEQFYSPSISNSSAAGLQIAIWDLVGASISASTDGSSWFRFDGSNDYGASADLAWVNSHPNATAADLTGLTGPGQAYAVATASLPPVITSPLTATGKLNLPFTYAITATNNPTSYGASGLPSGLSVNAATGLISGTPGAAGTYHVTLSATNGAGTGTAVLALTVSQTYTLTIAGSPATGGSFSGGGVYAPGTVVAISESSGPGYRTGGWGGADGSRTAAPSSASTTITMSANRSLTAQFVRQYVLTVTVTPGGTATGSGTYDSGSVVHIGATPSANCVFTGWTGTGIAASGSASTTIAMQSDEIITANFLQAPAFTSGNAGQILVVGHPCSYQTTATHSPTYGAASLPPGLTINPSSGLVSGTPTSPGSWSGQITATNAAGSASETVPFTVYSQPVITSAPTDSGKLNEPLSYTITATGNPTSYSATGLPAGLSVNPATGVISGTPTVSGTFPVSVSASNPGASGSGTVTITVAQTFSLAISGSPSSGGSFTGAGTYDAGAVVTITETAAAGYRASGWGGADGPNTAAPASASTTIVMSANRTLVADFVPQATLTVNAGPGGTATGSGTYDVGSVVTIAAAPNQAYQFAGWTGSPAADPAAASTTVTVSGNETVSANFSKLAQPPSAVISAASTAYTGSPFAVASTASAPDGNLTLHSIEWMSSDGVWTVNSVDASGSSSTRNLGITFPSTGVWTLRAGASVDNGNTWVYSTPVQVTVSSGITTYTLQTMAVPAAGMLNWYTTSPVVQKTYQVQHVNP